MFKKSRRKIVAAIMTILVLLWVGTLSVIYATSYFEITNKNKRMLKVHAEMYTLSGSFDGIKQPRRRFSGASTGFDTGFAETPLFRLSTFYTVAVSYDGDILEIENEPPTVFTDADLENLARSIIKDGRDNGSKNNLTFYKTDKDGYTLVTFMDNTIVNENAMTLFRYTLLFGGVLCVFCGSQSQYLTLSTHTSLKHEGRRQAK